MLTKASFSHYIVLAVAYARWLLCQLTGEGASYRQCAKYDGTDNNIVVQRQPFVYQLSCDSKAYKDDGHGINDASPHEDVEPLRLFREIAKIGLDPGSLQTVLHGAVRKHTCRHFCCNLGIAADTCGII